MDQHFANAVLTLLAMANRIEKPPSAGRFPLVSWEEVFAAHAPASSPTKTKLQRLQKKGVVSSGLDLHVVTKDHRHGRFQAFSALNVDAGLLMRRGETELAMHLVAEAQRQEHEWSETVSTLLKELPSPDLMTLRMCRNQQAHAWLPLMRNLEYSRRDIPHLHDWVSETLGVIYRMTEHWASLRSIVRPFDVFEVSRYLADVAGIFDGDFALIRAEKFPSGELLMMLAAVGDPAESERIMGMAAENVADEDELSPYLSRMLDPVHLSVETRAELDERVERGDAVQVPPRTIRLAS